ncbi:MAG TPA: protein translocase subunit SecD [Ktedonobacteraceae bacterium]|nr:protein translocase subunit SecD [Ktedonobacteraceae bacterium]
MRQKTGVLLLFILLLAGCAAYIDWPNNPGLHVGWLDIHHPLQVKQGLDLQGGVRVLLEPDPGQQYSSEMLNSEISATRDQIEQRVNGGLGVNEPSIRIQTSNGQPRISVELPGYTSGNQQEAINTLLKTGTLEFWNTGPQGMVALGTKFDPQQYTSYNPDGKPLFTGRDLDSKQIGVGVDEQTGRPQINFAMKGDAVGRFASFTQQNIGTILTVTLDREVIQSATIQSAITGAGVISGQFTRDEAQRVSTVLRYGALPIALHITSQQTIGPTLGQEAIYKSEVAGAIGLGMVMVFMLLYYRLPGLLADLALLVYAAVTFALFKVLGVTLTLAGITGFILSIGMAVDANVLIFERIKEELRDGRPLSAAIDIGWKRAWSSIRDSNICTIITCAVLYGFGSTFGASIIVGFATTLLIGVLISMFTSIVVTRTFLNLLVPTKVMQYPVLFGLPAQAAQGGPGAKSSGTKSPPASTYKEKALSRERARS